MINLAELDPATPTLIVGDALKVMQNIPQNSLDLIYVDEGYDDLEAHRRIGTTTRLAKSDGSDMEWYDIISYSDVIPFYSLLLKPGAHLYMWRPSINQSSLKNWVQLIDPNDSNETLELIISLI